MAILQRDLRASDRDREQVVVRLKAHYTDGRLAHNELAARSDAAYRAVWVRELQWLLSDLPREAPQRRRRPPVALVPLAILILRRHRVARHGPAGGEHRARADLRHAGDGRAPPALADLDPGAARLRGVPRDPLARRLALAQPERHHDAAASWVVGGADNRTSVEGVASLYPTPAERQYAPILIGRPHDTARSTPRLRPPVCSYPSPRRPPAEQPLQSRRAPLAAALFFPYAPDLPITLTRCARSKP